jgi:hypothetical protein
VGPLPKAVELPVSDTGTPSIGEGGSIVPASWDRGHGSLHVQAQENTGQQPHMRLLPTRWGKTAQTSPRQAGAPHTDAGRGPALHRPSSKGKSQPQSIRPRNRHSAEMGTQVPAKELGPTLTPG